MFVEKYKICKFKYRIKYDSNIVLFDLTVK